MEHRRVERFDIEATGKYRSGAGLALPVTVANLRMYGCQLRAIPRRLRRGDVITLRIANIGPIEAEVRWVEPGKQAGLEFLTPLHESVFDHVLGRTARRYDSSLAAQLERLRHSLDGPDATDELADEAASEDIPPPESEPAPFVERRVQSRWQEKYAATLFDERQVPFDVTIIDGSDGGCRLFSDSLDLACGSEIGLYLEGSGIYSGRVRWQDGGYFGLELTDGVNRLVNELICGADPLPVGDPANDTATGRVETGDVAGEAEPAADVPGEPASEPAVSDPADGLAASLEDPFAALPDLPVERLQNFVAIFEAARKSNFKVVSLRIERDSIVLVVSALDDASAMESREAGRDIAELAP